jgi:hypothetical protein
VTQGSLTAHAAMDPGRLRLPCRESNVCYLITGGRPGRADAAPRLPGKMLQSRRAGLATTPGPFVLQSWGVTVPPRRLPEVLGCFAPGDAFLTGVSYLAAMAWPTVS